MKLAVILTAYNRKDKTIKCINSLYEQEDIPEFDVYLCDDGSVDGTTEAISQLFKDVHIVNGTGSLFWTRGMFVAMQAAVEKKYDYYLMVNDDVEFFPSMWRTMIYSCYGNRECAVTGCTKSRCDGKLTYSGSQFYHDNGKKYVGAKVEPSDKEKRECDVANWNCFLVPGLILDKIGLIDPTYEHSFGDYDFSLRMRALEIPIYISCDYIGYCENNAITKTYKDGTINRKERIKKILAANGLPIHSWYVFTKRYYGKEAFRNFIVPYVKFFIAVILKRDC